jgi:serine/threonine protein kinase
VLSVAAGELGSFADAELESLLTRGSPLGQGIGGHTVRLDLADGPVFVKRVPLTDLELAHPRSTANLFGLPTTYQYGVGSAGFNAWRELAAHEQTTSFVRSGGTPCFPLLHHWRVLPRVPAFVVDLDAADPRWADWPAVRERIHALEQATSSLVLVLEYVPEDLATWWPRQDAEATARWLESQLRRAAEALHHKGLLHLDAHARNVLHDEDRLLVSDFGLVTSATFELDDAEREFVANHRGHDRAYLVTQLVNGLVRRLVPGTDTPAARNAWIAGPRETSVLPPQSRDVVERYAPVAVLMNAFYWQLYAGNLRAPYPYEEIDATLAAIVE